LPDFEIVVKAKLQCSGRNIIQHPEHRDSDQLIEPVYTANRRVDISHQIRKAIGGDFDGFFWMVAVQASVEVSIM
jgi:hypothetical protein